MQLPDKDVMCHHTGFAKSCFDGVVHHRCRKWVQVIGHNPNTGEQISRFDCADSLMPLLTIENSQQQRQTAASVDKVANEVAKATDAVRETSPERVIATLLQPATREQTMLLSYPR